ncbi:MAG TPA: hypothetical protein VFY63_14330 [Pseudorhizobium sp.]|nr:hypothetical protein [Pseudorhizobium sp.]
MDITAIAALVGSLKTAGDITKTVVGLRDGQMLQAKIIELQGVILSAQSSALSAQQDQFSMIERIRSLEQKVAQLEEWDTEAEQYELKQIDLGAFAYMKTEQTDSTAPLHWLCVNCFEHRRRSVLQYQGRVPNDQRTAVHGCPHCKATVRTYYSRKPGDAF